MDLEVSTPISAEAEIKQYTLVGDDIYVKRYTNENIPDWYRQLISDIIATDNTITDLDAAVDYLSTLPAGYNQKITELQLADTTINTSLESLVATTGSHTAAIANLNITKVDATSAAAISKDTVAAYFADGNAGAWFNNQISTYASDITANANNISTLSAVLDGQEARIDTVESVNVTQANAISALETTITTLETDVGISLADLQSQIDGAISTYFYDYAPTTLNAPYGLWLALDAGASEVRNSLSTNSLNELVTGALVFHVEQDQMYQFLGTAEVGTNLTLENYADTLRWLPVAHTKVTTARMSHVGDLLYDRISGYGYRFGYTDIQDTPDMGMVYTWVRIIDTDITLALAQAATAQSTADGKRTVYYGSTAPSPRVMPDGTVIDIEIGDLWVNSVTQITKVATAISPTVVWTDVSTTDGAQAYAWSAKSVKALHGADGSTMGFQLVSSGNTGDPTTAERSMTIIADTFKLVSSANAVWNPTTEVFDLPVEAKVPFSVDAISGDISFNGRVTFSNFSPDEQPITYKGEYTDIGNLPTVNVYEGYEAYVTGKGYYVYSNGEWVLRVGTTYLTVIESTNGSIFRVGGSQSTTLIAHVFSNGVEVTDALPASEFRWRRLSLDTVGDTVWNTNHLAGYKQIVVNVDDVSAKATFFCDIIQN